MVAKFFVLIIPERHQVFFLFVAVMALVFLQLVNLFPTVQLIAVFVVMASVALMKWILVILIANVTL